MFAMLYERLHSGLASSHFFFRLRHVLHPVLHLASFEFWFARTPSVLLRGRPRFLACVLPTRLMKVGEVKCSVSNITCILLGESQISSIFGSISSASDSWVSEFDGDL